MNRIKLFDDHMLRVTAVADLASLIASEALESARLPEVLDEFAADEGLAIHESATALHKALQDLPEYVAGEHLSDLKFTGVLLAVHTPVMRPLQEAWSFSWGQCRYGYVYGATYDDAVQAGLEWVVSCYPEAHIPLEAAVGAPQSPLQTAADRAVAHVLRRMRENPRLAYFICPATETFALLTEAAALASGEPVELLRKHLEQELSYDGGAVTETDTPVDEASFEARAPHGTRVTFLIADELLARIALVGGGDAFKDETHANTVLAHLVRLGLEQMENQLLNTDQEELF